MSSLGTYFFSKIRHIIYQNNTCCRKLETFKKKMYTAIKKVMCTDFMC